MLRITHTTQQFIDFGGFEIQDAVQVTDPEYDGSTSDILISIVISLHGSRTTDVVLMCLLRVEMQMPGIIMTSGYDVAISGLSSASGIDLVSGYGPFILLNAVLCHYFVVKLSWFDIYTAKIARHTMSCVTVLTDLVFCKRD
jgi:hypothetical protein